MHTTVMHACATNMHAHGLSPVSGLLSIVAAAVVPVSTSHNRRANRVNIGRGYLLPPSRGRMDHSSAWPIRTRHDALEPSRCT